MWVHQHLPSWHHRDNHSTMAESRKPSERSLATQAGCWVARIQDGHAQGWLQKEQAAAPQQPHLSGLTKAAACLMCWVPRVQALRRQVQALQRQPGRVHPSATPRSAQSPAAIPACSRCKQAGSCEHVGRRLQRKARLCNAPPHGWAVRSITYPCAPRSSFGTCPAGPGPERRHRRQGAATAPPARKQVICQKRVLKSRTRISNLL